MKISLGDWTAEEQIQRTPVANQDVDEVGDGNTLRHVDGRNRSDETMVRAVSNLEVAEALYRQEQRRWSFQPVESCFTAYQVCAWSNSLCLRLSSGTQLTFEYLF